jgi:hypothetical protein
MIKIPSTYQSLHVSKNRSWFKDTNPHIMIQSANAVSVYLPVSSLQALTVLRAISELLLQHIVPDIFD